MQNSIYGRFGIKLHQRRHNILTDKLTVEAIRDCQLVPERKSLCRCSIRASGGIVPHDFPRNDLRPAADGNAMAGMTGLVAKIAEADKATKSLVKSLELIATGGVLEKIGSKIEKAFKTVLEAGVNFQQVQNQLLAMGDTQKQVAEAMPLAKLSSGQLIHEKKKRQTLSTTCTKDLQRCDKLITLSLIINDRPISGFKHMHCHSQYLEHRLILEDIGDVVLATIGRHLLLLTVGGYQILESVS